MKPRSIVFTLYGDYLRYCGEGEATLSALTELGAQLGVEPGTMRVVMSRLRSDGWFVTRRSGRRTSYVLSEKGWRLLDEGRERIFRHDVDEWRGEWTMLVFRVPDGDRGTRDRLRQELSWRRCGQLLPSTWIAPLDRREELREVIFAEGRVDAEIFLSMTGDLERDKALAGRCWELEALDAEYASFVERHAASAFGDVDQQEAFRRRIRLTDDYRQFPFRDPDLPSELLPSGWRGWAAHELFAQAHGGLRGAAERYVESVVGMPIVGSPTVVLDQRRVTFS